MVVYFLQLPLIFVRPCAQTTLHVLRSFTQPAFFSMVARKRSAATAGLEAATVDHAASIVNGTNVVSRAPKRAARVASAKAVTNPDLNNRVIDGKDAWRASPDGDGDSEINVALLPDNINGRPASDSSLSDAPEPIVPKKQRQASGKKAPLTKEVVVKKEDVETPKKEVVAPKAKKEDDGMRGDPDEDGEDVEADPEEIAAASSRPPAVNSDYLPLPWKGRLGYACLCTYLRYSNPPVFCSRTTRIASILEYRHPLKDPSQPAHPTKNRPDRDQPPDVRRGQQFVEALALQNVRDMAKLIQWNDRYGIKFLRLSSEAFPFASHAEYGYKLAPFAAEALAEVGKVAAELGHRLTTHPGQFTQLGSPRKPVINAAFKDLEYHDEMLSLLKLPPQQNRDAIMVLHMGGVFGDKAATLDRFRENYAKLSQSIKNRLVLENDDMSWSVHDLLPVCQELNIPLVLDFHHHNIIFDADKIREGSKDIIDLYPAIRETWARKGITQKMHYSEPTPPAITGTQRRKHNPRVWSLPPCPNDMDLMIEAKDKEQAVFELMRTFKLPGFERIHDIIPYVRKDDNKAVRLPKKKATPKKRGKKAVEEEEEDDEVATVDGEADSVEAAPVPEDEVGMGGPEGRVYWPPTMEEWLRPKKREVKKKSDEEKTAEREKKELLAQKRAEKAELAAEHAAKAQKMMADGERGAKTAVVKKEQVATVASTAAPKKVPAKVKPAQKVASAPKKKQMAKREPSTELSEEAGGESSQGTSDETSGSDEDESETKAGQAAREVPPPLLRSRSSVSRNPARAAAGGRKSYNEFDSEGE